MEERKSMEHGRKFAKKEGKSEGRRERAGIMGGEKRRHGKERAWSTEGR